MISNHIQSAVANIYIQFQHSRKQKNLYERISQILYWDRNNAKKCGIFPFNAMKRDRAISEIIIIAARLCRESRVYLYLRHVFAVFDSLSKQSTYSKTEWLFTKSSFYLKDFSRFIVFVPGGTNFFCQIFFFVRTHVSITMIVWDYKISIKSNLRS